MSKIGAVVHVAGDRFGRLVIVSRAGRDKFRCATWNCLCDCGKECVVSGKSLRASMTKSCGCLHKETLMKTLAERAILPTKDLTFNIMFRRYEQSAKSHNRCMSLTRDEFMKIISLDCSYCGSSPKDKIGSGLFSNGIDRVDSNLGYTIENCVPCCERCNKAKSNLTTEEFKDMIKAQYNHFINPTTEVNLIGILGSVDELIRFHREAA